MRRAAGLLAALLVLAAGARAAEPERLDVPGAWTVATVPPGEWARTTGLSGDAQFSATFAGPQGRVVFEVRSFLSRDDTDASTMLAQAIQTVETHAGADGLAIPSRRPVDFGTRPAAQAEFAMTFGAEVREGTARIVRGRIGIWTLAWGYASRGAREEETSAVRRFVESLEPTGPRLFEPRFTRDDMDRMLWSGEGEEPLSWAAIVAAGGLVEAHLGTRLPLRGRDAVEEMLANLAREGGAAARTRLRDALLSVRAAEALPAEERARRLQAAGDAFVAGLEGTPKDDVAGLASARAKDPSVFVLGCVFEWAEFLAELALDAPVRRPLGPLVRAFEAEWPARPEEDRKALREFPAAWASARWAWDHADATRRFLFRREALAALSPPAERERVLAIPDDAALRAFYDREPPEVSDLVGRASGLDLATRTRLLDLLPVDDRGYRLGW